MSKKPPPILIFACIGLIVLGVSPILFHADPAPTAEFFRQNPIWRVRCDVLLAIALVGAVVFTGRMDPERGMSKTARIGGFALIAALLTDQHFFTRDVVTLSWQIEQFNSIFEHNCAPPDQYRFLPQGILWWLFLGNGDFVSSYLAYRFIFTFLLCQAIYHLARAYLPPRDAVITVFVYSLFYGLSIRYYNGNLLDPMFHAAILALLACCCRQKFATVFWLCALGMFIKETTVLAIPCYYLLNLETFRVRDARVLQRLSLLGIMAVVVFLACRMPFHYRFDFRSLNRTNNLMILSNLGLNSRPDQATSTVPVFVRYLHPLLFIFIWLPLIIWRRKFLPRSLFWTSLYFSAAIYLTNLCFSWNYESRNFIPALVVLVVCTLVIVNRFPPANGLPSPNPVATDGL